MAAKVRCILGNHTHLEGDNSTIAFYEHLDELENIFQRYIIILCVGSAVAILGLMAPILTWIIFPRVRTFQNYISLNQCIAATGLPLLMCAGVTVKYDKVRDLIVIAHQVLGGEIKPEEYEVKYKQFSNDYNFECILLAFVYVLMCLCCWTTATAVLCYEKVVNVFSNDVPRKYLLVNSLCYGIPVLGLALYDLLRNLLRIRKVMIMLGTTAACGIINTCIYLSVVVAIYRAKKPGQTFRAIMTSFLIFVVFGLCYSIAWMVILHLSITTFVSSGLWDYLIKPHPNQPVQEMINEIRKSYVLFYIQCALVSVRGIVLCVFFVGKLEIRKLWIKYFCNCATNKLEEI